MTPRITIAAAKRLTLTQELELHRAALARRPGSAMLRGRLASLLIESGKSDQALELLRGQPDLCLADRIVLIRSLLARRTDEADRAACQIAEAVPSHHGSNRERAAALALLGKAQARLGNAAARASFERALVHDPASKDACKRLAAWLLEHGEPQAVLDFAEKCAARGAVHPWHFAAQVLALAMLGRFAEARWLDGRRALGMTGELPAPAGWDCIAAFNAALTEQLLVHPELHYEAEGTASEKTWRIDALNTADAPLVAVLLAQIGDQIERHFARLRGLDHPWLVSVTRGGALSAGCRITTSEGHETWHMHEHGSLSGVYYVEMPAIRDPAADRGGCIAFGLPSETIGDVAADGFGLETVRPVAGQLLLFPSHCFHRTYPHGSAGRRISIAFDVWPD